LVRTPADAPLLEHLAALLQAARPAPDIPPMSLRPGGLTVLVAPPVESTSGWIIGFQNGARLFVAPDVVRCSASGCTLAPGYATLDGAAAHVGDLLSALQRATAHLPQPQALVLQPSPVAPGGPLRVHGAGWVGPRVRLTITAVGEGPSRILPLAVVAVDHGVFRWSGELPGEFGRGTYELAAGDGVRAATVDFTVS
jgi:hypothetical protein